MNYIIPYKFHLISRNEGKIKSYESCMDVRAWNHDTDIRGSHLRAWIKRDMPCCVIPVTTLAAALRIMGCRSRGRVTSRCHLNCKSKVVLESICASCQTIKECLKVDPKYEKYFEEEEFETSHWPCERCLDALKGIKMLWKIILDKIFRLSVPKTESVAIDTRSSNVINTAKSWQTEIVHEAAFLKNSIMQLLDQKKSEEFKSEVKVTSRLFSEVPDDNTTSAINNGNKDTVLRTKSYVVISKPIDIPLKVSSQSISVEFNKVDVGCETSDLEEGDNKLRKKHLNNLQDNVNELKVDLERLKKENMSLKIELQSAYNESALKPHLCARLAPVPASDPLAYLPKPFDDEQKPDFIDDVDSEMIITMKNCRNSGYKQVSLLQVLHKSRQPFFSTNNTESGGRKEDPIHVLQKLQTTFGAIMQREKGLVSNKKCRGHPPPDINASYYDYNLKGTDSFSKM